MLAGFPLEEEVRLLSPEDATESSSSAGKGLERSFPERYLDTRFIGTRKGEICTALVLPCLAPQTHAMQWKREGSASKQT